MKKLPLFALGLFLLGSVSCSRDEQTGVDQQLLGASSEIDQTNEIDFKEGIDLTTSQSTYESRSAEPTLANECLTITVDNPGIGVFPKTYTLDYGDGCTFNGITRAGTLTITLTDYFMNAGSVMTIERGDDYFINGRKLEGTINYNFSYAFYNLFSKITCLCHFNLSNYSGKKSSRILKFTRINTNGFVFVRFWNGSFFGILT